MDLNRFNLKFLASRNLITWFGVRHLVIEILKGWSFVDLNFFNFFNLFCLAKNHANLLVRYYTGCPTVILLFFHQYYNNTMIFRILKITPICVKINVNHCWISCMRNEKLVYRVLNIDKTKLNLPPPFKLRYRVHHSYWY